jgi:CRP-like cAMP-binding protein
VRHESATVHELARVGLLAELPGDVLAKLGLRMRRQDVPPGHRVVAQGEEGNAFYVVLSGLLNATQEERGVRTMLRPGAYFGEVSLLMDVPRTASVLAVTPAVVASCDRETFDEFVRPLFTGSE